MEMEDKTMKQPELGQTILELRQRTGLTQSELTERCNMSLRTIQRIEAQEVTPRNYTIKTILSCLGYDPHEDTIGNDDSQDKDGNGMPRQKRLIKHIKELFNLKTNTMKKLSILSLFVLFVFAGAFFANTQLSAQGQAIRSTKETLIGVWQQVIVNPATGEVETYIPFLKIFNADDTYIHMQMKDKKPAFLNASGKWKVTDKNVFLEYVELMYGQGVRNHTEEQTFTIEKQSNGLFMHSKFHTRGTDMADIYETWKKCDFSEWGKLQTQQKSKSR